MQASLADGRHWSNDPSFRLETFDTTGDGALIEHRGSALVYFDSGNDVLPSVNLPPSDGGGDPHGAPRPDAAGTDQRATFLRTGPVVDVYNGAPIGPRPVVEPSTPTAEIGTGWVPGPMPTQRPGQSTQVSAAAPFFATLKVG